MAIEIKIPSVGESVQEAVLTEWYKKDGDSVKKGEPLFVIETDKVTLEVEAEESGRVAIAVAEGETVPIGAVVGSIDTDAAADVADGAAETVGSPTSATEAKPPEADQTPAPETAPEPPLPKATESPSEAATDSQQGGRSDMSLPPSVRRLAAERGIDPGTIPGTGPGGRITKGDVILHLENRKPGGAGDRARETTAPSTPVPEGVGDGIRRKAMTPIRRRIAERLLEARRNTAMLTTFNEIDMSRCMALRSRYKEPFEKKHGIGLGFMSFFVKACVEALKEVPEINAFIDGADIVYHEFCHVGVAVGSDRGLVVPVIRNAEHLGFADIEKTIMDFVKKIKENRLEISDLEGGTFTISNGGVFGSLLSTPILNTPQSGILGMHKIEKRPVVVNDEIVIRPMMYVALSYDHRIVDGREAVTFLKRVKEFVEDPERILMEV
ncbi:MAG: 2-oxoglutarate dehydrogenase complex dihydrolipoyllysine-residue succinyltransferase [Desulfobacterales bacterium]|jgi:2-oxoglutarate dehydrogenase E2 component (dihydrolipoamide succinyltransferase)